MAQDEFQGSKVWVKGDLLGCNHWKHLTWCLLCNGWPKNSHLLKMSSMRVAIKGESMHQIFQANGSLVHAMYNFGSTLMSNYQAVIRRPRDLCDDVIVTDSRKYNIQYNNIIIKYQKQKLWHLNTGKKKKPFCALKRWKTIAVKSIFMNVAKY